MIQGISGRIFRAFSCTIISLSMLRMVSKYFPFSMVFIFGKNQKSHAAKSRELVGSGQTGTFFSDKNLWSRSKMWHGALSQWRPLAHFSYLLRRIAYCKHCNRSLQYFQFTDVPLAWNKVWLQYILTRKKERKKERRRNQWAWP